MKSIKSLNVYFKGGKGFAVIKTERDETYCVSLGLIQYAIQHAKEVKNKEVNNEKNK